MRQTTIKKTAGNHSTLKTMRILEVLGSSGQPMRLLDIAEAAEVNVSTALRFINSLIECGYVFQEKATQKYMLTLKVISLWDQSNFYNQMKFILRDVLVELAASCNESVCLAINQDNEVIYLDVVDGPSRILKATQKIGHRAPLYCTGVGKLHLLNYNSRDLQQLFGSGMAKLTENTLTTLPDLLGELDRIKDEKWAIDNEECEPGLRCVAAPIMDKNGKVIAALSVTGPTGRITENRIDDIRQITQEAAAKAAKLLGY